MSKGKKHVPPRCKLCCDTRGGQKLYYPDIVVSNNYFKTLQAGCKMARVGPVTEDGPSVGLPRTIKTLDMGRFLSSSFGGKAGDGGRSRWTTVLARQRKVQEG